MFLFEYFPENACDTKVKYPPSCVAEKLRTFLVDDTRVRPDHDPQRLRDDLHCSGQYAEAFAVRADGDAVV